METLEIHLKIDLPQQIWSIWELFRCLKLFQKYYQVDTHLKLAKSFNNHTTLSSKMSTRKLSKQVLEACQSRYRPQQHQANLSLEMKYLVSLKKVSSKWQS